MSELLASEALAAEIDHAIETGEPVDLRDPVRAAMVIKILKAQEPLDDNMAGLLTMLEDQEAGRAA